MESVLRFPTNDLLNGQNLIYTPRLDYLYRRNPNTIQRNTEGTDVIWTFPRGGKYTSYVSPMLKFTIQFDQPFDPNNQLTQVPAVWGDPWIGLYGLFRTWRIMIGGATRKTFTAIELRAWMDYQALTLDKEHWAIFQRETRCRYTHVSQTVSGTDSADSALAGCLPFFKSSIDRVKNIATYWCHITLPIPFWNEIVPLNSEQREAYPFGVIPMGVFQEPITIIATLSRGDCVIPQAPTVYYETSLENMSSADHTTSPAIGNCETQMSGVTSVRPMAYDVNTYLARDNDLLDSQRIPSIFNACNKVLTVPGNPTQGNLSMYSWDGNLSNNMLDSAGPPANAPSALNVFYFSDDPDQETINNPLGFAGLSTSPNSWWSGANLGALSTVRHFGPACTITPYDAVTDVTTSLTSYTEWSSGSTGYLQFNGHFRMPGVLEDYIPPALIGLGPELTNAQSNKIDMSIENTTLFTNLMDPTLGLRNSSQIAVLARVDKIEPLASHPVMTYHPANYSLVDIAGSGWTQTDIQWTGTAPSVNIAANSDGYSVWASTPATQTANTLQNVMMGLFYTSGALPRAQVFANIGFGNHWILSDLADSTVLALAGNALIPPKANFNNKCPNFLPRPSYPIGSYSIPTKLSGTYALNMNANQAGIGFARGTYNPATVSRVGNMAPVTIPNLSANVEDFYFPGVYNPIYLDTTAPAFNTGAGPLNQYTFIPDTRCFTCTGSAQTGADAETFQSPVGTYYPPLYNYGGCFAGSNFYHQNPPPLAHVIRCIYKSTFSTTLADLMDEYFSHRSIAPVITSKWFFNDRNNVDVKCWNYAATLNPLRAASSTWWTNPLAGGWDVSTQASATATTDWNVWPNGGMMLQSLYEAEKPSYYRELLAPITPGYCLDLVPGFRNPFGRALDFPTGTFDNVDWVSEYGPILSGFQPSSYQLYGMSRRGGISGTVGNASYQQVCAGTPTTYDDTAVLPDSVQTSLLSNLFVNTGTSSSTISKLWGPMDFTHVANDPMYTDRIRTTVHTSRTLSFVDGVSGIYAQLEMPEGQASYSTFDLQSGLGSHHCIGPMQAGTYVTPIYPLHTSASPATPVVNFFTNSQLDAAQLLGLNLNPGAMTTVTLPGFYMSGVAGASISFPTTVTKSPLYGIQDLTTVPVSTSNSLVLNAMYKAVNTVNFGGTSQAKLVPPGHTRTDSVLNIEQLYTPYPRIFVGVIGGGYGALGVNQLKTLHILDSLNTFTCHPANPYTASQSSNILSNTATDYMFSTTNYTNKSIYPPGTAGLPALPLCFDESVKLGHFPPIPAPIFASQVDATLTCIVAAPAYPDLISSGSAVRIELTDLYAQWAELDCSSQTDIRESFDVARNLMVSSGLPTMCCSQEVLLFTIPPGTTEPSVSFNLQGNNVHGIRIRIMKGRPYGHQWQDLMLEKLTVTVGADTVMPLTADMLHYPVRPRYLSATQLPLSYYPPSSIYKTGAHVVTKHGLVEPYSLDLQKVMWQSVDTSVDWHFDRLNQSDHFTYDIPFATGGPIELNANVVLRMRVAQYESNTYLPILQFDQVPHPTDILVNPLTHLYTNAENSRQYMWPSQDPNLAYQFLYGGTGLEQTNRTQLPIKYNIITNLPGTAASTEVATMATASLATESETSHFLAAYAGCLAEFTNARHLETATGTGTGVVLIAPATGSVAASTVNAALGGYYSWNFQGTYTEYFPGGRYFPPEWLGLSADTGIGVCSMASALLNGASFKNPNTLNWTQLTTPTNWANFNQTCATGLTADNFILPASNYQPFGIHEYALDDFQPVQGEESLTVEVTIVRSQQGLLRNNIYATRM